MIRKTLKQNRICSVVSQFVQRIPSNLQNVVVEKLILSKSKESKNLCVLQCDTMHSGKKYQIMKDSATSAFKETAFLRAIY